MRILILSQYFWPENFQINDLVLGLKQKGHEVNIFTGKPNYPLGSFYNGYSFLNKQIEYWNEIKIYRCPVIPRGKGKGFQLFVNYISFALFASINLLFIRGKYDKIFVYEPSPITVGIPAIIAKYKFKAPIYFWVQDLWPESISSSGGINNKFVIKIFDLLTKYIYNHSKKILVQSKAFIPYILDQNIDIKKLIYFPNTCEKIYKHLESDKELMNTLPKGVKLIFAGNIGESQSFETLLNAAFLLKNNNVKINWVILGEGRMKEFVQKKIIELELQDSFYLLGSFPSIDMPKYFSCADALIVSLKKDKIFTHTIPSKIQAYLACGKPIISCLDGEGARIISEANAGITCPAEDFHALYNAVKNFLKLSINERIILGINGRKYFDHEFERDLLLNKLEQILLNE
jgi:glycosyltransferase involved in cell wall biosynthesis